MVTIALQMLVVATAILQRQLYHNQAGERQKWDDEYDYIVVGAGSAGSVLAARLTQDSNNKLLLLEAGGSASFLADSPNLILEDILSTENWGYVTTPQINACNMYVNDSSSLLRGKVVGGSAMINAMIYNRGNRRDFDSWAENFSAGSRWNYESLLPYFRKIESFQNSSYYPNDLSYHGFHGPVTISAVQNADPIHFKYQQAWADAGYQKVDINGRSQVGFGLTQNNVDSKTWSRASSAHVYLYPALKRENLHLITKAHVTKLIINNQTVWGVEFRRGNETFQVKARKEVILSAGAIGSPQLLMLSGIGPKSDLERFDIELVKDLPVGQNFQDHALLDFYYIVKNESNIDWSAKNDITLQTLYDYYVGNTGPLTQYPVTVALFSTPGNDDYNWPDITLFMRYVKITEDSYTNVKDPEGWAEFLKLMIGKKNIINLQTSAFRTYSRGSVRLASKDPFENPIIDPAFLVDSRDLDAIVDSLVIILDILDTDYFRSIAEPYNRPIPGCKGEFCYDTHMKTCRKYLVCYAKQMAASSWHLASSTPMGNKANFSVVDSKLRVHGIQKLRVADASVMPRVPNGNTNAPTMVIADVAADLILAAGL